MPPSPVDIRTRIRLWRRRVAGAGLGVFAASWIAVFAVGQHGHAGTSTGSAAQPSPAQDASAQAAGTQDPYTDGGAYGDYSGYSDPYAGQSQPSQSSQQQSQAPLVTRQS
jgi:hypothetical protein